MPDDLAEHNPGPEQERSDAAAGDGPFEEEEFDAEEAEWRIARFVTSADELPGPSVEELAERVAALMRAALREVETLMEGEAHNKVLATQLLLSQRARALGMDDPEQWPLHAASTLLSGLVVRGIDG